MQRISFRGLAPAVSAALTLALFVGITSAGAAQNVLRPERGIGAKYGSRDPVRCASTTAPEHGAISAALAAQYVTCQHEHVNDYGRLFLATNVHVQVGRGVPFKQAGLYGGGDVDPNGMVYAIRGSFDNYLCTPLSDSAATPGQNCALWHETHATGYCLRTTFGDWKCSMEDLDAQQLPNQPPPK